MKIRKATSKDLKAIAELMKAEFSKPPYNEKAPMKDILKSLRFYLKIGKSYVVEVENRIVGVMIYKKEQYWDGPAYIIEDLAISSGYQGKGMGKSLMKRLESDAKNKKVKFIYFITHKKSKSVKFYEKLGYKQHKNIITLKKQIK